VVGIVVEIVGEFGRQLVRRFETDLELRTGRGAGRKLIPAVGTSRAECVALTPESEIAVGIAKTRHLKT
jgi:hypothetical protein